MNTVITMVCTLLICIVYGAIQNGWVKSELEVLHNRMNASNSETQIMVKGIKEKVQNAQAIASNALSSAQRAESKIMKHTEMKEVVNA